MPDNHFRSTSTSRSPEVNLAWLVAVIAPDLITRRGHSDDGPPIPGVELAKAMQGRQQASVLEDAIGDSMVQAVYDVTSGDDSALDVLVEGLSTVDADEDLARLTAFTLVACGLLADRDDVPT